MNLSFIERPGQRNIDVPFAAFIDGHKLQFNKVANEKFFIVNKKNYYIAFDKEERVKKKLVPIPN